MTVWQKLSTKTLPKLAEVFLMGFTSAYFQAFQRAAR